MNIKVAIHKKDSDKFFKLIDKLNLQNIIKETEPGIETRKFNIDNITLDKHQLLQNQTEFQWASMDAIKDKKHYITQKYIDKNTPEWAKTISVHPMDLSKYSDKTLEREIMILLRRDNRTKAMESELEQMEREQRRRMSEKIDKDKDMSKGALSEAVIAKLQAGIAHQEIVGTLSHSGNDTIEIKRIIKEYETEQKGYTIPDEEVYLQSEEGKFTLREFIDENQEQLTVEEIESATKLKIGESYKIDGGAAGISTITRITEEEFGKELPSLETAPQGTNEPVVIENDIETGIKTQQQVDREKSFQIGQSYKRKGTNIFVDIDDISTRNVYYIEGEENVGIGEGHRTIEEFQKWIDDGDLILQNPEAKPLEEILEDGLFTTKDFQEVKQTSGETCFESKDKIILLVPHGILWQIFFANKDQSSYHSAEFTNKYFTSIPGCVEQINIVLGKSGIEAYKNAK